MSTSRIGRMPVAIPQGVEVKIQGQQLSAKGPKGQLVVSLNNFVTAVVEDNNILIHRNEKNDDVITGSGKKLYRSIVGTERANVANAITGVSQGFERKLTLVGVGYRAQAKGKVLALSVGYSHPTEFNVPEGITIETPTQTEILVKGVSKKAVGEAAANIRSYRGPEPYKGKGIRYSDEVVELKETKKK